MSKAELVKSIVKKNVGEKPTFGTDPKDPWSAKANIAEDAALDQYLISRGINPKHVTKDQKVAHSKTNQFKSWMRDHSQDSVRESITVDKSPTQKKLAVLKTAVKSHKEIRTTDGHKNLHSEEAEQIDELSKSQDLLPQLSNWSE